MKNINRKNRGAVDKSQSGPKVYGCVMPKDIEDEPASSVENDLHQVYRQYLAKPKVNTYGLGYVGLDRTHVNLFQPAKLTVRERNNKKLSIAGQAFGVGAFEDEDEDIYVKDDMSHYDFELTAEAGKEKVARSENLVFGVFVMAKTAASVIQHFPPPVIPASFSGKHNIKKSRFEPALEEPKAPERKEIDATVRAKYLGENSAKTHTPSAPVIPQTKPKSVKPPESAPPVDSSLVFDRFVAAKQEDDVTNMLEPVKPTDTTHGTSEMHAAVKLKMFGPLTRVTLTWQPNGLLCKRFNVPEPKSEEVQEKNKKRTKNLIFEYQKQVDREVDHKPGLSVQNVTEIKVDHEESLSVQNVDETKPEPHPEVVGEPNNAIPATPEPNIVVQKPIDETERVDVSKNADLFKAVFLSSSESESDEEDKNDQKEKERNEQLTASVVSEPLVLKIKPIREGILSNIQFKKKEPVPVENKSTAQPDMYGPQLPVTKVSGQNNVISVTHSEDEWVEKDDVGKEKKHKKKHKKEKHRKKHKDKTRK